MEQANALSFKEEFLTCSICTNVFRKPCTLRCGHSFCCECLGQFLLTRHDSIQANRIPCAYCRQFTPTPRPSKPVTEWAGQIPCSLLLRGLLDRYHQGGKDGKDVCFLCQVVGEGTPATSWCSDCEITLCARCKEMHLKGPSTTSHGLFDLSEGQKVKQHRTLKCKTHIGEKMTFFCKDCSLSMCPTCCFLKHRSCRGVVTLKEMIPVMQASLREFREKLEQKTNEQVVVEKMAQTRIKELVLKRNNDVSKLKSIFENAIEMLRVKLKKANDATEKEYNSQISKHKTTLKSAQDAIKLHTGHFEFIDKALQTDQGLVEGYEVCQSGALEILGSPHLTTSSDRCSAVNTDVFTTLIASIEKLVPEGLPELKSKSIKQENNPPKFVLFSHELSISHKDDLETPRVGEVTLQVIDGGSFVIVTDIKNKSLKSLCKKERRRYSISRLNLSAEPWRMSRHESSRVVTTLGNRKIAVVEVKGSLRLISQIETEKQYLGIASLCGGLLAVSTSSSPFAVDILDLTGKVLKSLTSRLPGLDLMDNPFNLCTTPDGNICVTDAMSKLIHCITPLGEVVFTYMPTKGRACSNVAGTSEGNILVTDYGHADGIYLLDREGRFMKDNLQFSCRVSKPLSVVSSGCGNLYVCEEDKRCIKVLTVNDSLTI